MPISVEMMSRGYAFAILMIGVASAAPPGAEREQLNMDAFSLEKLMSVKVKTATMTEQTLRDAPAAVTIISAAEIRRYGYRTLSELLANVRSFYTTQDGALNYTGVRGFSLPGDYNTRFLVMINGHDMTDNVYSAMYLFGQDFPLDMDLVDQVEIVRGPSSALYGSNGLFATINIITRRAVDSAPARVSTELGSFGEQKLSAASAFKLGRGATLLLSGAGFHTGGRNMVLPLEAGEAFAGRKVHGAGNEAGYHSFANLTWGNWNLTALFGDRRSTVPTGWFGTTLNESATTNYDHRGYAEASWSRSLSDTRSLKWRGYYDRFRYDAVYRYRDSGYSNIDAATGDWVGTQFVFQQSSAKFGLVTLGAESTADIGNGLRNFDLYDNEPPPSSVAWNHHRNAAYAVFGQHEYKLSRFWTFHTGIRLDDSRLHAPFVSPRAALIYNRGSGSYKVMYGRGFRDPSTFERHYEPNPLLAAERMNTYEFSTEHTLNKRLDLTTAVFHYHIDGLIQGFKVADSVLQYRNVATAYANGVETELSGHPATWLNMAASVSMQHTQGLDSAGRLQNSPVRLGHVRASVPLLRNRMTLSGVARRTGSRLNAYGTEMPGVTLTDLTLDAPRIHPRAKFQFGVRNLFDHRYSDPLSQEHATAVLPRAGRTVYLKVTWQSE